MKKIEVVSINPAATQVEEVGLKVGQQFEVRATWKDRHSPLDEGEIQVDSPDGAGQLIILNKSEYKVIE